MTRHRASQCQEDDEGFFSLSTSKNKYCLSFVTCCLILIRFYDYFRACCKPLQSVVEEDRMEANCWLHYRFNRAAAAEATADWFRRITANLCRYPVSPNVKVSLVRVLICTITTTTITITRPIDWPITNSSRPTFLYWSHRTIRISGTSI